MNSDQNLLGVLTREGVLIKVSVRFWRGTKKLKPEDIGLDPGDLSDRLISLGHKRLLPREALSGLALVEGRAHALVEANTFPFLNGLAHFLPNGKLAEVTDRLKELEGEFWKARDQFLNDYRTLREAASREWRTLAEKLAPDPDRLVSVIEASFPGPGIMNRFFGFDLQLFQISAPERLGFDLVTLGDQEAVLAARREAAAAAGQKIREDAQAFVSDCIASLREQTATLCEEMLESIRTCDTGVHQKTLNRLVHFIDQFKAMNFANDSEMEHQLQQVRQELLSRTAEEYRNSAFAQQQLTQGLRNLSQHARELAKTDSQQLVKQFGEMGRRRFSLAA
jgi:hypothetical protein